MISLHISPRSSLPQSFTSLYRLFLRATSASVLHQSRSTRSLRRLWRPTFKYAGNVIHRLQSETLGTPERARMESWLKVWDTRMDSTLNLLYSSTQSRSLSHKLTRNLAFLQGHHLKWAQKHYYSVSSTWKPQLDPSSPEYIAQVPSAKAQKKEEKKRRQDVFDRSAWDALGEVVTMAEGRHGIMLGRATFNKRRA